jgi:hypothetical protein
MRQVFIGAVLVIAGIAAFIEAHTHRPFVEGEGFAREHEASHLSHGAYDLLRIGGWALVIVGGLLVVTGLIRYWGTQRGGNA